MWELKASVEWMKGFAITKTGSMQLHARIVQHEDDNFTLFTEPIIAMPVNGKIEIYWKEEFATANSQTK